MSRITVLLLALTLTGSPVSSAVCAAVCGHGTSPAAHCHESLADEADVAIAADIACGVLAAESPYVKADVTATQPFLPETTLVDRDMFVAGHGWHAALAAAIAPPRTGFVVLRI